MKTHTSSTRHPSAAVAAMLAILGIFCLLTGAYLGLGLSRNFRDNPPRRVRRSDVESIQLWMTLEYISRAYGTPENELERGLNLEPHTYHRYSLSQIAKEKNMTSSTILEQVRQIVIDFQSTHQQPPK